MLDTSCDLEKERQQMYEALANFRSAGRRAADSRADLDLVWEQEGEERGDGMDLRKPKISVLN